MVLYFLDKVTALLSQQTTHPPARLAQPARAFLLPAHAKRARVHCAGCRVNLFALYTRRRLYIKAALHRRSSPS